MKWIKLGLFLVAAANFFAFVYFLVISPTVRFDLAPALKAAQAEIDRIPDTPELYVRKQASTAQLLRATEINQLLQRYHDWLGMGFTVFELANILIFGSLFIAIMFIRNEPKRRRPADPG